MSTLTGPARGTLQTTQNTSAFIKKVWIPEIKRTRQEKLDMMGCLRSGWPQSMNEGDTFEMPTLDRMYTRQHVPGVPTVYDAVEPGRYTFTITRNAYVAHLEHKWLAMQTSYNLRTPLRQMMAYAMAEDMNNFILGMRAVPGTQVIWNTSNGTSTGTPLPLSEASILSAKLMLKRALAPEEIKLWIAPEHYVHLVGIDHFINERYVGNKPIATGRIGSIHGIPVVETNNIHSNAETIYIRNNTITGEVIETPAPGTLGSYYLPDQEDSALNYLPVDNGSGVPFITAMMCAPTWAWFQARQNPSFEAAWDMDYQAHKTRADQLYGGKSWFPEDMVLIHTAL